MWHKLQENPPYFLLTTQKNGYEVYITDYVTIWFVYLTNDGFLTCLQDSNFGLDDETSKLIKNGTNLLLNPNELRNLNIAKDESSLQVSMTKRFEYPLKIKLKLSEGCREMFFNKVTHNLLRTVIDLTSSQKELRHEMKKKDREIDAYKSNNHARYLKTERFNDNNHMERHSIFKESGDLLTTPESSLEKIAAAASQKEEMVQENLKSLKIKQESHIPMESQSAPCLTSSSIKQEPKVEPRDTSISPRKKRKQLLNY
ncbi:hypothetical protein MSG28_002779 [Choristoneura fumiferana]|uniref:Uncharacterized protein n=1 Tax=Choristoneura fumiferana TaxID=7141 RepID=A0ACC0JJC3_CHOFU|nr:hypothetical protein MSG28_002779 [Choristoneura fumiferana]